MDWNKLGMDLFNNTIEVLALETLNVSDMISKNTDSDLVRWAKYGAIWSLADEVKDFVQYGQSQLLNGNYYFTVDNMFFNTAVWAFLDRSNLGVKVAGSVSELPLLGLNSSVSTAIVKVSAKMVQDMINQNYSNTVLNYLVHWSLLWRSY